MRKHNEGYTLPLVMVVMVVLCLVAVSIMSVSLNNLQRQKAHIERMEAQYAAQGQLEIVISKIDSNLRTQNINRNSSVTTPSIEEAQKTVETIINTAVGTTEYVQCIEFKTQEEQQEERVFHWVEVESGTGTDTDAYTYSCTILLRVTDAENNIQIDCKITLEEVMTKEGGTYHYHVPEITYVSYDISSIEEVTE